MKAVFFEGDKKISVRDWPIPSPKQREVLVKVKSAALCGSDMQYYFSHEPHHIIEGHENAGIIVDSCSSKWKTGDKIISYAISSCGRCQACKEGDRMFCEEKGYVIGGFSEYIVVPENNCLVLPDFMDYQGGSVFCDCIGLSFATIKKIGAGNSDWILIIGAGPVGLGMLLMAKLVGSKTIIIDINPVRLKLAKKLGADFTIHPLQNNPEESIGEIMKGEAPNFAIDCAGKEATQLACMKLCRKGGTVVFVGGNPSLTFNPNKFLLEKGLCIIGNWYFNFNQFNEIIEAVKGKIDPSKLVTHSFKLDDAQKAFELFASGNCGKITFVD